LYIYNHSCYSVTAPVNPVIDDVALTGPIGVTQTAFIKCNGDDTAAITISIDITKDNLLLFSNKNSTDSSKLWYADFRFICGRLFDYCY
jgi:hypothetical protein